MKILRVVFSEFGEPSTVLRIESADLPNPGPGEALVRIEMAPVNPADLNLIEGKYGIRPELPAIAGLEAGGVVEMLGPGVNAPAPGTRVLPPLGEGGSWQTARIVKAADLTPLPAGITAAQAATLRVNPSTALRLLSDFVDLKPGDWIAQNAANSAVGRHVIQIARHRGLRTVNLVRRPELVDELSSAGGDVVLVDDDAAKASVKATTSGAAIRLGLNCVGGESATRLAGLLSRDAVMVTFGAMSRKALTIPNALLIFKEITFKGFWVTRWIREAAPETRQKMFDELGDLALSGVLNTPVDAVFPLDEVRSAVQRASQESRSGKVLLDFFAA